MQGLLFSRVKLPLHWLVFDILEKVVLIVLLKKNFLLHQETYLLRTQFFLYLILDRSQKVDPK